MKLYHALPAAVAACAAALPALAQQADDAAANPAAVLEAPTVEVVGTTPLPGIGTPINQVPGNVQAITGRQIEQQQSTDLSDFLNNNIGSVNINSGQANPFMPDVNFRGFTASPLLGLPQGISVFLDGVRVNEAFGDVVNWDLIPQAAISTVNLIPGSNPVFGLNTLGGALGINTKSGKEYPGASLTVQGGSWGRVNTTAEFGGKKGPWDFYVMGNYFDEDGWREHSASTVQQLFGKVGYETGTFDADLSYSFGDNRLQGTQTSPLSLLDADPKAAYTYPDKLNNRLDFLNLKLSNVLADDKILAGNVYYRKLRSNSFGSNVNDNYNGATPYAACDGTVDPVTRADGRCPATNDTSQTETRGFGGTLQFSLLRQLFARDNKLTVGASYDEGKTTFKQFTQDAIFTPDRGTVGTSDFSTETAVDTTNRYYGLFATDTFAINPITFLTLSGRYNWAKVKIQNVSGNPADDALNGDHSFDRFNPAVGLNWNPSPVFNTWASYNEGMRVPTPAELTCADPTAPCKLPNAFLADPPLKPVISRTFELGSRGALTQDLSYTLSAYRTDLNDDIQFISASGSGTLGYFQNVGKTRRQGLELGLQAKLGKLSLSGAYGFIDATYRSTFAVSSPANSSADAAGDIVVRSGDKIPGIPQHNLKLRADYAFTPRLSGGVTGIYASDQYARGDENNQDANGKVPSYFVVNLDARYHVTDQLQVFGKVTNLFDTRYEVFGVLGENFFSGPNFTYQQPAVAEQFRSPGAPRGFFVGVRYDFVKAPQRAGGADLDQ
jgi:outer membrane receptor protein involved in Fe transport